jgi:hypothetical protein
MNLVDALAGGDFLKWDAVMYSPYLDVFTKLMMNKEQTLYARRYQRNAMQNIKNR